MWLIVQPICYTGIRLINLVSLVIGVFLNMWLYSLARLCCFVCGFHVKSTCPTAQQRYPHDVDVCRVPSIRETRFLGNR